MSVVLKHDSLNSHANSFPPYGTMSLISIYTPYVQARPDLNPELQTRLKITDSRSPVMITGQIFFSPDKPRFWPVKLMNIIIFFLPDGISNYAGSRSLCGIVVQVLACARLSDNIVRTY